MFKIETGKIIIEKRVKHCWALYNHNDKPIAYSNGFETEKDMINAINNFVTNFNNPNVCITEIIDEEDRFKPKKRKIEIKAKFNLVNGDNINNNSAKEKPKLSLVKV